MPRDGPGGPGAEERRRAGVTEVGPALLVLRRQGPALSDPAESTDGSQSVKQRQRKTSLELTFNHTHQRRRAKKTSKFTVKCFYLV